MKYMGDAMNNATMPLLTGWRYWAWRLSIGREGKGYHKDPELLAACPRCGAGLMSSCAAGGPFPTR